MFATLSAQYDETAKDEPTVPPLLYQKLLNKEQAKYENASMLNFTLDANDTIAENLTASPIFEMSPTQTVPPAPTIPPVTPTVATPSIINARNTRGDFIHRIISKIKNFISRFSIFNFDLN